jgi:hypothetical protein
MHCRYKLAVDIVNGGAELALTHDSCTGSSYQMLSVYITRLSRASRIAIHGARTACELHC